MHYTLTGQVLDHGGMPLADATVMVAHGPRPAPDMAALTGQDGRFGLPGLVAGQWRLEVYGPYGERGGADAELPQATELVLVLRPGPQGA